MLRTILLLINIVFFINIFSYQDIGTLDSIFSINDLDKQIYYTDNIKDKLLKQSIKEYFIANILEVNNYQKIKKFIPKYDKSICTFIKSKSYLIKDKKIIKYLISLNYEIKNFDYYVSNIRTNKKYIHKIIKEYPKRKKTIEIFFENIDMLSDKEIIDFTLNNFNLSIVKKINEKISIREIKFFQSLLEEDTLYLKIHTNENINIIKKIKKKKYRLFAGRFINEKNTNNYSIYYKGRFYEENNDLYSALKIYERIKDNEAIIRIIAKIGEYYSKEKSDSILLNGHYNFDAFLYHKAKLLYIKGRKKEAKEIFNRIIKEYPLTYYSVQSRKILNKKLKIKKIKYKIDYYIELEKEFSKYNKEKIFYDYIYKIYKNQKESNLKIAYLYYELKIYYKSIYYAYKSFFNKTKLEYCISYIYPMPYKNIFEKAAKENNVDIALLYAIAREESWFNPNANSPAGAKGIMQLMDFVYEEYYNDNDYFYIEKNIKAGAMHLSNYMDKFEINPAYGIMSYNAGPGNVIKWERKYIDWELYLEMIPFRETRIYIKNVLRNYYYYKFVFNVS